MISLRRLLVLSLIAAGSLGAQGGDTAITRGVRLALQYEPGVRPGIAVLPVKGLNGDSVRAILVRDLDFGDRVEVIGASADMLPPVSGAPNYSVFAQMRVSGIVEAVVTADGLHIVVYDVKQQQQRAPMGFMLAGAPLSREWRMSIHGASDEVERWATGVRGIAATRVTFVRDRKVWVVDSDGAFPTIVAAEAGVNPCWHPNGKSIAYALMPDAGPGIAVRDLVTNTVRHVARARSGSFSAPAFSPDGNTLVYSFGVSSGHQLYAVDLRQSGQPKLLTTGSFDNTAPTFSADGHRIAFTSGRLQHPEVYIAAADGSDAEVLIAGSFGDNAYRADPAWSPDGRLIAFASQIDGQFQIMTSSPTGKNITPLTSESTNEDPAWAPDGRHIVFTSERGGSRQLWIVDTESFRMRQLTRGTSAKGGAWSPSLAQ